MFATYEPLVDQLLLLEDVPRLPDEPGACLAAYDLMSDCTFGPTDYNEEMRQVSVEAAERAGVDHVDPTSWLCADDLCPVVIGSTIAYRDRAHITATRAAELWWPLGVALGLHRGPTPDRTDRQAAQPRARRRAGRDARASPDRDSTPPSRAPGDRPRRRTDGGRRGRLTAGSAGVSGPRGPRSARRSAILYFLLIEISTAVSGSS